jgi:hypothetical protein
VKAFESSHDTHDHPLLATLLGLTTHIIELAIVEFIVIIGNVGVSYHLNRTAQSPERGIPQTCATAMIPLLREPEGQR